MINSSSNEPQTGFFYMRFIGVIGIGILLLLIWLINQGNISTLNALYDLHILDIRQHPVQNKPLTKEQLNLLDKQNVGLQSQLTVISFWEHWCPPCKKELPTFSKLQEQFDKSKVNIVLINTDPKEYQEKASQLLTELNMWTVNNQFASNGEKFKATFQVEVLPTTYILNKERQVVYELIGSYDWSGDLFIKDLKELLLKLDSPPSY